MFLTFPAFSAGELSPLLEGRQDLDALKSGCRLARNVIPQRLGPLLQRPGLMYRGLAQDQSELERVNLWPFVATSADAYVIEAGKEYLRFWKAGSLLLTTADNVGRPGVISGFGAPLMIATPYSAEDTFEIQRCAANDVMWIAHPDWPVYKLTRYAVGGFYFEPMAFVFPPLRDLNAAEITLTVTGTLTVGGSVDLLATGGDVFETGDVGGYYGIDHRRDMPFVEISLSQGSGTASAVLSITATPGAAETVTIGKDAGVLVYTWGGDGPYGVPIGTGGTPEADSIESLTKAVNGAAGVQPGTIAHTQVTADNLGKFTTGIKASGILSFTDNDLTAGTPDEFSPGTQAYTWSLDVTTGSAYHVQVGATLADSIANAILAINATGTPGVNYTAGTLVNTQVSADAAAIGSSLRVQALTGGAAGNDIPTTVDHTSRMSWASSKLTGGADGGTWKMQVAARIEGEQGNSIAVAETMANGTWQPTDFLTGGADNTNYDPSNPSAVIPTVRVNGTWEVYTLGRWYGTLTLQQQRSTGEWEAVRAWDSQNDHNVQTTGTVDGEKLMRLIFVGAGIADDAAPARAVLTAIDAIVHGLVLITSVIDSTHAQGTVIKEIWSSEPTYLWSGGSWSERRGYPSAVVLHQQRLVFGQGSRIIGSQTGGFDNFFRGDLADDSYQYELAATVQTNIVSMQSQQGLIILTETDEWLADGGGDGAVITPANIRTQQISAYGSAVGPSQIVHNNVVFMQVGRLIANEYLFNFGQQNYEAVNLGELADHLTREQLREIAWAPVPHSLLYFVTQRGSLLSLAYRRSAGNANEGGMLAWSKNTTADGSLGLTQGLNGIGTGLGNFESVCVVPASNEISDVWVSVRRQLPDASYVRTIESYDPDYWDNLQAGTAESIPELVLADGSVRTTVLAISPTVTGLNHLEGLTVSVLLAGFVHPNRVVSGGEISLDMTGITDPVTVCVGVPVTAELQPWFATPQMKDGGGDGRTYNSKAFGVRWYFAGAAEYADDNSGAPFFDVIFRDGQSNDSEPVPLFTGLKRSDAAGGWMNETRFIFRNRKPLPCNISGITVELVVASHS